MNNIYANIYSISSIILFGLLGKMNMVKHSSGPFDSAKRRMRISKGYRVCRFLYKHRLFALLIFLLSSWIRIRFNGITSLASGSN